MIEVIRRISQCQRVLWGFMFAAMLTGGIGAIGVAALRRLSSGAATESPSNLATLADTATVWLVFLTVAVVLVNVALGVLIRASIKAPLEATINAISQIGAGDLESKVSSGGRDELSWMNHEINQMRKKLRTTILTVRESAETVAGATEEIARGNTDLSVRTESQAAALQETASNIEQLSSAVKQNAQHAIEAERLVSQTTEVAHKGDALMHSVITRMSEINSSASRITEIIGVIDGIAFQTNILALNAAVEAARAGEHGRGFAVVAAEVRTLAQRSANAAKEIKTLISDSTEKVEAGTKLVDQAGETMQEIMSRVTRVSDLVSDIAVAGQTQSEGIGQIHSAIGQLDGTTQQNAALVEEAAAASQSLKSQTNRLAEAMSKFRVVAQP